MPEQQPLEVLTAREVENLVLLYAPAIDVGKVKNYVSIVMSLAKMHGVMIVKADPQEFRNHLRFLTRINWTP